MRLVSGIKSAIGDYIVIKECIENGEFDQAERIIVVGTKLQAAMVRYLFRSTHKKVYYCKKFERKYTYTKRIKWIIFDSSIEKKFLQKNYNILLVPNI